VNVNLLRSSLSTQIYKFKIQFGNKYEFQTSLSFAKPTDRTRHSYCIKEKLYVYLFQHDKLQSVCMYKGGDISIYSLPLQCMKVNFFLNNQTH